MQSPSDPFAFLRSQWSGLGTGFQFPNPVLAPVSLEELDRRIADLRIVEQWLGLNLNLLKTTLQGLEIQRGTLVAVQSFQEAMGQFQMPSSGPPDSPSSKGPATQNLGPEAEQARRHAAAWWEAMQGQFQQLVQQAQSVTQATAQAADATVRAGQKLAAGATETPPAAQPPRAAAAGRAKRRSTPRSPRAQSD